MLDDKLSLALPTQSVTNSMITVGDNSTMLYHGPLKG